jgi:hypothetical protein
MHKESFIINCNTLLHFSTLLGHLQGELFVIVTLRLHFIVEWDVQLTVYCVVFGGVNSLWSVTIGDKTLFVHLLVISVFAHSSYYVIYKTFIYAYFVLESMYFCENLFFGSLSICFCIKLWLVTIPHVFKTKKNILTCFPVPVPAFLLCRG